MTVYKVDVSLVDTVDYFTWTRRYINKKELNANYPFVFAGIQFKEDNKALFLNTKAADDKIGVSKMMFDHWEYLKGLDDKSKYENIFREVKEICEMRSFGKPDLYNGYVYYLANKYLKKAADEDFLLFSKESGLSALKARQQDTQEYYEDLYCAGFNNLNLNTYTNNIKRVVVQSELVIDFSEKTDQELIKNYYEEKAKLERGDHEKCWWNNDHWEDS